MASLRDFIPWLNKEVAPPYSPLSKAHKNRADLFDMYWRYYRGHHRQNIKVKAGQADDNVTENWSKKIVNAGIDFLFGKVLNFEVEDEGIAEYLTAVWGDDDTKMSFLQEVAQNGAVCGTPFLRLYPADDSNPYPRIVNIDPAIVDIKTASNDVNDITGYWLVWRSMADREEDRQWLRHRIERDNEGDAVTWLISEDTHNGADWRNDPDPLRWEYSFAPIFHCKNLPLANSNWGISDLEDADLNDAINFSASNINRVLRFFAHPRTVVTGDSASNIKETAVDLMWSIDNEKANVFNLEMASDLASSRAHKTDLTEALHQIADVPRLDPDAVNLGALSGFALRILYGPLLAKTTKKQRSYGGMITRLNQAILTLNKQEGVTVTNKWADPLPSSDQEKAAIFDLLSRRGDVRGAALVARYSEEDADRLASSRLLIPDAPN